MTKNPTISTISTKQLLELSMSINQHSDFKKNASAFTSCLKKLLKINAFEIWYRDNPTTDFLKVFKSDENILRSSIFSHGHPITKFSKNKFYHSTIIDESENGIYRNFTDLKKGVIHAFKLSDHAILLAYQLKDTQSENTLSLLEPLFQRFSISLEQSYFYKKLKNKHSVSKSSAEALQKFKLVIDNVSEGLLICNLNYEIIFANNRISELSEYTTDQIIGKHLDSFKLDRSIISKAYSVINEVFKGKSIKISAEHTKKISKSKWWVTANISPYKNSQGKIVGAIATIRDISKEQVVQQALKESQDRYNLLIENGFDGVLMYDLKAKKLLSVNDKLLENFGYSRKEFMKIKINKTAPEFQPNGLTSAKYLNQINQQIIKEGKINYDWVHQKKDGSVFYVEITAVKLLPPNDHIKIEIHKDITERFLSQQVIIENEERLAKLFDMSPIPILIRSINSLQFRLVNKKFTELFGYNVDDLNKLTRGDLVYKENTKEIKEKMEKLLSGEISDFKIEKQYIRKDGSIFWGTATRSLVQFGEETWLIGFIEDITARKRAIAELEESKAKVRAIFDSTTDKIIAIDRNFHLIDFNKSGENFLAQFYGNKTLQIGDVFIPREPEIRKEWAEYYKKALQGESFTITRKYKINEEDKVDLVNIFPIKDHNQNVIGITLYGKDITELNNTQLALQKSESQLKEAQRIAKIGNWQYDPVAKKLEWSEGTYKIFEIPSTSPAPNFEAYKKLVHPEDLPGHLQTVQDIVSYGGSYELENRKITATGKLIYTFSKGEALVENGKVVKVFGTIQDISAQKKVELELIESNKKYQDLFNNMYDALLVTDEQGYFIETNKAAQRLLEYSHEELKKIQILNIVHPDDIDKSKTYLQKLKEEGYYSNYNGRIITKSGKVKYLQVNSNAIIEGGKMVGSRDIARDITEIKEAEIKREQLYAQLEIANKELKDFAYIVSHDLKAPLRAIGSLSSWIAEDYKDLFDEEGKKHLELLVGRSNRMQNFIEGILQYSRLGRIKLEKEPISIKTVIDNVIESLDIPKFFKIEIAQDIPSIVCEKIRIHQVFQNLISNAIKYNDKAKGSIKIEYQEFEQFHQFCVEDNGPGIDEKHFDKIFKIFQTLQSRDELESTGIGLTIVKRIVELHGGTVSVRSTFGKGSKFSFTILK